MKESNTNEENIDLNKPLNINELLEPLVDTNKKKTPKKKVNIYKSVNLSKKNYEEIPEVNNEFSNNSIEPDYKENSANNPINRIRREIYDLKKDNETEISNYSNTPGTETIKFQNFITIIVIAIFSSLQYGIYLFIFNLYMSAMNSPPWGGNNNPISIPTISRKGLFYSFFLVLSWKYQIYLIIYLLYALYIYFKLKRKEKKDNNENLNDENMPLNDENSSLASQNSFINSFQGNPTFKFREFKYKYLERYGYSYESYYNIFINTSNIFNIQENDKKFFSYYFNLNEIIKGFTGILFAYSILVGAYFYYFGIIYLIQETTALLPYYINQYNKKNPNNKNINNNTNKSRKLFKESNKGEYYKYFFPILIAIGFYYLQKTIVSNILFLLAIFFSAIAIQIYNQKKFLSDCHEESPFQILFRTYFNYSIISLICSFTIEIAFNGLHFRNIFYWVTDIKIFLSCLIGFGILGAICYNMLVIFIRISLSNNIIVKLIKYFNILIIDLFGIFLFRQYTIASYLDYIFGISLCAISMFLLDFHKIL